ncbi:MAG: four helix bundle protein [Nitrospirales bacterium]|nr:four helix bundle protein [Nitrospirales bacterium]
MGAGYKELTVWQKAKDVAVFVYRISGEGVLSKDFGLRDQIRRSAVSVASNLAEGDERDTDKDSVRFFFMAKGSLAELRTQIQITYEVAQMEKSTYEKLESQCGILGKMIGSLIQAQLRAPRPSPRAPRPARPKGI